MVLCLLVLCFSSHSYPFMYLNLQRLTASSVRMCLNDGFNATVCLCMGAWCSNGGEWAPLLAIQPDRCQVGSAHRSGGQVETWRKKKWITEPQWGTGTARLVQCRIVETNTRRLLSPSKKSRRKAMKACIELTGATATTTTTAGANHLHRHAFILSHKTIPYEVRNAPTHTRGCVYESRHPVIHHKKKEEDAVHGHIKSLPAWLNVNTHYLQRESVC